MVATAVESEWHPVCASGALRRGGVQRAEVNGRAAAVWRGTDGTLAAVDALCPHLGADLSRSGRVENGTLVCAFHGWRFDRGGACTGIGYEGGKLPRSAHLTGWEVREEGGQVYLRPPVEQPLATRGVGEQPAPRSSWPEGWYKVGWSSQLPAGAQQRARYFGRDLTLRRPAEGLAQVVDDAGRTFEVRESGDVIMVWYGPEGPTFEAPDYSDFALGRRRRVVRDEVVHSSLWDVAENPFDAAHLSTVHYLAPLEMPRARPEGALLHLEFVADPNVGLIPKSLRPRFRTTVHVEAYGLGLTRTLIESHWIVGDVWMIGCNTPVDADRTEYTLVFMGTTHLANPIQAAQHQFNARLIWKLTEVERVVWRHKRYLKKPCLLKEEKGIGGFRRWARQFRVS